MVGNLLDKLIEISRTTFLQEIFSLKTNLELITCAWFDEECKNKKQLLNRARKSYQKACKLNASWKHDNLDNLRIGLIVNPLECRVTVAMK